MADELESQQEADEGEAPAADEGDTGAAETETDEGWDSSEAAS
jgi:hypothetical protein